jgi:hypothetical protein
LFSFYFRIKFIKNGKIKNKKINISFIKEVVMNFRTDMAVERHDIYKKAKKKEEIPGISVKEEKFDSLYITHVEVINEEGKEAIGKEIGDYITVDLKKIKNLDENEEKDNMNEVKENSRGIRDRQVGIAVLLTVTEERYFDYIKILKGLVE